MFFLLHYDRKEGRLVSTRSFLDGEIVAASAAKLDLEISLVGSDGNNEIVLFEAQSEDDLRKTHRRYFSTLEELKENDRRN